nr:hypothetical protein [Tanacetum cinerariifolium]
MHQVGVPALEGRATTQTGGVVQGLRFSGCDSRAVVQRVCWVYPGKVTSQCGICSAGQNDIYYPFVKNVFTSIRSAAEMWEGQHCQ